MLLWFTPRWRRCYASSTGFHWATSLKPNSSAPWCIRYMDMTSLLHCGRLTEPRDFANDDGSLQPYQFLNVPMFRNVTLKCLTEIAGVSVSQYEEQFVTLFTLTMCQLKQVSSKPCSLYTGADFFFFHLPQSAKTINIINATIRLRLHLLLQLLK